MSAPAFVRRLPSPPRVRVPVLYVPAALEAFEAAIGPQEPEYGDEVVDGYIGALVYDNSRTFWPALRALRDRGIVWLPEV